MSVNRIRVAEIPYLNSAPFYWKKAESSPLLIDWVCLPPKQLGDLAREGNLDAGPMSLADSFEVEGAFEPLADLGIAVKNAAQSVLLFSRAPIFQLGSGSIGLTDETATSSRLLQIILEKRYDVASRLKVGFEEQDSGRLLIGDGALKELQGGSLKEKFPHVYDLGEEWKNWQGLPFVFAVWMVRKDASPETKRDLAAFLNRALRAWNKNPNGPLRWHKKEKGWEPPEGLSYLKGFNYHLGGEEKKSISLFRAFLAELPRPEPAGRP